MRRLELAALLLLGLLWGSSFLLIKVAVRQIPPFTLVLGRVGCAAAVLLLLVRLRGLRLPAFGPVWAVFLLMGLLNGALPYTLISVGEETIDSGLAAVLNATMPIFTIVLAHFLVEERLRWEKLLGVALGLVGVIVLVGPDALRGLGARFWAQLAVVGAAVSYSFAAVVGRKYLKGQPAIVSAAGQLAAAAVLMAPLSLLFNAPWRLAPSWTAVGALLCLSLLGTSLAYLLYFYLLKNAGATNTSLVTYLLPLTGLLWGALLLAERVQGRALAALLLILAGVTLSGGWLLKRPAGMGKGGPAGARRPDDSAG